MEFIKMTKKGNVKVIEAGKPIKLYAKHQFGCANCELQDHTPACLKATCGPMDRQGQGWFDGSTIFVREPQ